MDFLKEYLGDELYAQVEAKLKGNDKVKLANIADGSYIAKADVDTQLADRDGQLAELKKAAGSNTDLQAQITKLQENNAAKVAELEGALAQSKLDGQIDTRLTREGAVNLKAVRALLDTGSIKVEGDKLTGLDEQLTKLRESDPWAFGKPAQTTGDGANPPGTPKANAVPQGARIL